MNSTHAPSAVPVLDLRTARLEDGSRNPSFIEELRRAAHDVGFFQLTGFGAAPGEAGALLDTLREFFARPVEEREALSNLNSRAFRGYTSLGAEITRGRPDSREQIDYGPDRPALDLSPDDAPYWRLQGPNQWPSEFPRLEEAAMAWAERMSAVAHELLGHLAVAIGLPEDQFTEAFEGEPAWMGKLVHYVGGLAEAGDQGVGSHADYGFITLLLQDQVGGLEVQPHGTTEWLPVTPIEDAVVVNLGEMLEVATDGYLMATIHRVQAPPAGVDRYAVPFFYSPRLDARVDPVTLPEEFAREARGVSQDPDNPMLPVYGDNVLKGWLRAHPRTAAAHYPELVGDGRARA
ncbi:isopenicillin N synthase family dioxygenase [Falsarthrobacter nasiphocae]|uniref:Isopenicillin N synthase-like dioxygenase n=1 Tax=Falsarthrobacter nasiphocae TaxID=189863 RepID=A0AAE3YGK2_9MICC|nr:2-oxoglutarate and iron-dependent oxygenase domain-containing protein [Falsarthrobacter nasiphocae]MDR6891852.1 isopenicillin N synthase-like dioxygenase [Falsarthrobacter nasiphocae]